MAKGSNFLKFALDTIKLNYEKTPDYAARWVPGKTGPVFFTSIFVSVIHRQLSVFCSFHLFVAYFNISLFISIYSLSLSTYFIPISTYSCTLTLIFLSNFHPFLVYFHPFHANILQFLESFSSSTLFQIIFIKSLQTLSGSLL